MNWHSWQEFWAMGGYGLYVWGSMGVVFAVLVGEVIALAWRRRVALADLALVRQVKQAQGRAGQPSRQRPTERAGA